MQKAMNFNDVAIVSTWWPVTLEFLETLETPLNVFHP